MYKIGICIIQMPNARKAQLLIAINYLLPMLDFYLASLAD